MKISVKVVLFTAAIALFKGCNAFEYGNQALWYDIDGSQCSGDSQSPIELRSHEAIISPDMPQIKFHNYDRSFATRAELKNKGYTVELQIPQENHGSITGGPLKGDTFITESLHFHWGSRSYHGSEHVVDNHRSSMEMHIVHRNSKYPDMDEATRHEDGLAVLGVFFDVETSKQKRQRAFLGLDPIINALSDLTVRNAESFEKSENVGLKKIVEALPRVQEYNSKTEVSNLKLSELFDSINTGKFYSYHGSLTTPPCWQSVNWIVFPDRISISENVMEQFRSLSDQHGEQLVNNYRQLQATGWRQVHLRTPLNEL